MLNAASDAGRFHSLFFLSMMSGSFPLRCLLFLVLVHLSVQDCYYNSWTGRWWCENRDVVLWSSGAAAVFLLVSSLICVLLCCFCSAPAHEDREVIVGAPVMVPSYTQAPGYYGEPQRVVVIARPPQSACVSTTMDPYTYSTRSNMSRPCRHSYIE